MYFDAKISHSDIKLRFKTCSNMRIDYQKTKIWAPFKGGALGCSLLSLLGNPALAIVENVVRPIDGHFKIQYGHHAYNPR